MSKQVKSTVQRLAAKTPQQHFLQQLCEEYEYAPRVARAILEEARDHLLGDGSFATGQMRVLLAKREASPGRPLSETEQVLVTWTIDAGAEDLRVLETGGRIALRQARIVRLLDEALDQGAVATQEDLARALQTSVSTIKRDCAQLRQRGLRVSTRGYVKGIGRGQSHKAQIIERWMQNWTYDQIARDVRHDVSSIQRYVNHFIRVVWLQRQSYTAEQIAHLLQIGIALVNEYLALAQVYDKDQYRERMESCLQRICGAEAQPGQKKVEQ